MVRRIKKWPPYSLGPFARHLKLRFYSPYHAYEISSWSGEYGCFSK
ncbi:Putative protein [Zobellia galactanivorans]|uniref:Uncharacterized protein n=1 Tax=Zobellia galactanivorans (strain DSM 12802 / CCUG 47099 / CIP 106680 / NCIMB 13871 / Dsij) TaxID=63186 RepID=G0L7F2_ZOBGA|nr:Putative protein [Zobellia galactanivorans]